VDEGATGKTHYNVVVCVHGQPTWGYLYWDFIPSLTKLGMERIQQVGLGA